MSKKKVAAKPIWHTIEPYGYGYALIPSKASLQEYMDRIGEEGLSHDQSFARTYEVFKSDKCDAHSAVVIADDLDKKPLMGVIGIINHEAVHVFQNLCRFIGEHEPSPEFEAYSIQSISQILIEDYVSVRRRGAMRALGF